MIVTVRRSKTDQEGHGAKIGIPRSRGDVCPVAIVERWIKRISEKPLPPEQPIFVKLGVISRGKWWSKPSGRLPARSVSKIVKTYAKYAGMNWQQYAAHYLRRGLARHTRHRSVKVLRGYIEDGTIWAENPLPAIYTGSSSSTGSK